MRKQRPHPPRGAILLGVTLVAAGAIGSGACIVSFAGYRLEPGAGGGGTGGRGASSGESTGGSASTGSGSSSGSSGSHASSSGSAGSTSSSGGVPCATSPCTLDGGAGTCCSGTCVDIASDPHNCGACAHDCLGGACAGSLCQPIVLGNDPLGLFTEGIALGAPDIYFGDSGGHVFKLPLAGGTASAVGNSANSSAGVALSGSTVYWGDNGNIYSAPTSGITGAQPVANFASLGSTGPVVTGVAADANNVYVTTSSVGPGTGLVVQAPSGGGTAILLASGVSYPPFPAAMKLDLPLNVAAGKDFVYWANPGTANSSGTIMRVPIGGGAAQTLATGQAFPWGLTVDATNVYWTNLGTYTNTFADGAVMKLPLAGGTPPTALASSILRANAIAVDATDVYFSNLPNDAIQKVPIAGGASPTVITYGPGTYQVMAMAVDATSVYWSNNNAIYKVAK